MQRAGQGFYTIGSSGHEGMAAVAAALRPTDMAFLHYRDAAFQIARAWQVPGQDPARDMLLSFAASSEDPISGGRHKVLGSRALMIPPQTSTIASHLPKAVGAAFSIGLARRNPPEHRLLPDDAIVMASFGDASANHSTAQGAFNTAQWTAYQNDAPAPALRLRGQWHRHLDEDAARLDRGELCAPPGPDLPQGRRTGPLRHLPRSVRGGRSCARPAASPSSCICAPCASTAMPAPTCPPPTSAATRSRQTRRNDPLLHSVRLLDAAGALSAG